jgi:predicted DNA binding protein
MAEPFVEHGGPAVEVSVDRVVELEDGTQLQYWTVSDISLSVYLDIIERRPPVIDVDVISTVDGTHRIEIHSTADSLFATFAKHDGHPTGGRFEDGTLIILGEFPATVDDDAIVEGLTDTYPDLDCVSRQLLSTPQLSRTLLEETLSERQWTAFQLAYYAGYFDRPRKRTGEDIADRMDITRQTFHRHLREAHRRVAQFVMEDLNDSRAWDSIPTE